MKYFKIGAFLAGLICLCSMTAFASTTTAAQSMHYGKTVTQVKSTSGSRPIVITNYSNQYANVRADFVDGSSNTMTIYPAGDYPRDIISIDRAYPHVDIEVTATDGTVLFPEQPVYPGQNVNIGSPNSSKLVVSVKNS